MLDPEPISGYADRQSYYTSLPDSPSYVNLSLSASPEVVGGTTSVAIQIFRFMYTYGGYMEGDALALEPDVGTGTATTINVPQRTIASNASHCGASWPSTFSYYIQPGLPSGLYGARAKVVSSGASFGKTAWIPFVVKARNPSGLLVLASTNTWQAYNDWPLRLNSLKVPADHVGQASSVWPNSAPWTYAHSYYAPFGTTASFPGTGDALAPPENAGPDQDIGRTVSFLRPNPWGANPFPNTTDAPMRAAVPGERDIIDWIRRNVVKRPSDDHAFTMIADSDHDTVLQAAPERVYAIVVGSHSEYWTEQMKSAVDAYLRRGGHLLNLSGNTANWKVEYRGSDGSRMWTAKSSDPGRLWMTTPGPEEAGAATSFRIGTQSSFIGATYRGGNAGTWHSGSFARNNVIHWAMTGTYVSSYPPHAYGSGLPFGASSKWDGAGESGWNDAVAPLGWGYGCPKATGCQGAAVELDALPDDGQADDATQIALASFRPLGFKSLGDIFYVGRAHGGGIFGAGSVTFSQSMSKTISPSSTTPEEPYTSRIIGNVIARFKQQIQTTNGDFTGSIGGTEATKSFTSDFMCRIPGGYGYSGEGAVYVAATPAAGMTQWAPYGWCPYGDIHTGDINGDHKTDLLCANGVTGTVTAALSTGSSFQPIGSVAETIFCSGPGVFLGFADVDGDGRDDLVCHNGTGVGEYAGTTWVRISTGTAFDPAVVWTYGWCGWAGSQFGIADFDGDGRADVYCHDTVTPGLAGKTWVALSTGSGFDDPYLGDFWLSDWCSGPYVMGFGVADVNGDGFADIWCHHLTGSTEVAFSSGARRYDVARSPPAWTAGFRLAVGSSSTGQIGTGFCTAGQTFGMADVDGDGRADAWCRVGGNMQVSHTTMTLGSSGPPTWSQALPEIITSFSCPFTVAGSQ